MALGNEASPAVASSMTMNTLNALMGCALAFVLGGYSVAIGRYRELNVDGNLADIEVAKLISSTG